jgi:hypothetical protein
LSDLAKEAIDVAVVERRCQEIAPVCEREAIRDSNGQSTSAYAGGGRAERDAARNQIQVSQAPSALGSMFSNKIVFKAYTELGEINRAFGELYRRVAATAMNSTSTSRTYEPTKPFCARTMVADRD